MKLQALTSRASSAWKHEAALIVGLVLTACVAAVQQWLTAGHLTWAALAPLLLSAVVRQFVNSNATVEKAKADPPPGYVKAEPVPLPVTAPTEVRTAPVPGKPIGRIVHHDPRSRGYEHHRRTTGPRPSSVRHVRKSAVLNQGQIGSCTGNALVGALGTTPLYVKGRPLGEKLAVHIYSLSTGGQYPPNDVGSSGLAVCKVAVQLGLIARYEHTFSFPALLDALAETPVIIGINWYDSFDTPDAEGVCRVTPGAKVRGGHEVELLGYDDTTGLVYGENSWGRSWGLAGHMYFTYADLTRLLAEQGDCTVPLAA